jgi:hypothetical protein
MYLFTIVLRAVHIVAGAFWVGAAVLIALFVQPAAAALGPEGGKLMQRLAGPARMHLWISVAATLTVAAGLVLFYQDIEWVATVAGRAYSIGGATGIAAWLVGLTIIAPAAGRMTAVGREVQASGGAPTAPQATLMQALQGRLRLGTRLAAVLLLASVLAMAVARYL